MVLDSSCRLKRVSECLACWDSRIRFLDLFQLQHLARVDEKGWQEIVQFSQHTPIHPNAVSNVKQGISKLYNDRLRSGLRS